MSSSAILAQTHYRFRTDALAVDTAATWGAAEDATYYPGIEVNFRIRFAIENSGTASAAGPFVLRVSKNGGAYTAITTSTGPTLGAQSADASASADETTIATAAFQGLSASTPQGAGGYDETGSLAKTLATGTYTQLEYGLILKTAGAAAGDTFAFRLYNSTTAFTTYSQTPTITVPETSGTDFAPKYPVAQFIFSGFNYNAAGRSSQTSAPASSSVAVGDLLIVSYAVDNAAATDGDEGAVTSITDTAGNTYTKAAEWTKSGGVAQGGVTAGLWYCQLTNALNTSHTLTINFSSSADRDAVAFDARAYTVAGGKSVSVEATATGVATATTAVPSLNPTTANIECLRVRVAGGETNVSLGFATRHTVGWTTFGDRTGSSGTAATSASLAVESLISTGTGGASSPSALSASCDQVGVYVAFKAEVPFTGHVCLAENISSASSVSNPTLAIIPPKFVVKGLAGAGTGINASGSSTFSIYFDPPPYTAAGDLLALIYAVDNNAAADGDEGAVTGITDVHGNVYTKAKEWTNSRGAALAGVTTGVWYTRTSGVLPVGYNATVTLSNGGNRRAFACMAVAFTVLPGFDVEVEATNQSVVVGSAPPGSLTATTADIECLRIRAIGAETSTSISLGSGVTPGWTNLFGAVANSGATLTSQAVTAEGFEGYGTSVPSSPSNLPVTADQCSVYVAFRAVAAYTGHVCLANDVNSASSVTTAAVAEANASTPGASLVTAYTPGTPRNDHTGEVGVHVAPSPATIVVSWLGLYCISGNTGRRVVRIYNFAGDVLLRTYGIDLTGKTAGTYAWIKIAPLTLTLGSGYSLMHVTTNGDGNYWSEAGPVTMQRVTGISALYRIGAGGGVNVADPDKAYVGFDLGWDNHACLANDVTSVSTVKQATAVIRRDALANDVLSTSSVTQPAVLQRHNPLANDVLSPSSVTKPTQLRQLQGLLASDILSASSVTRPLSGAGTVEQALLANDIKSNSLVTQPSMGSVGALLANDVKSNSSVTQPNAAITRVCLANDVKSNSSVTTPATVIRRDVLANDVKSNSSVTQPAAIIGRTLLANDVLSPSSVSQPLAVIQRAILANDVVSPSKVGNPIVGIVGVIDARDITSASSVTTPLAAQRQVLDAVNVTSPSNVTTPVVTVNRVVLANDVLSPSSVSQPVANQRQAFLANDVLSASSVTKPAAGQIVAGQPLANDIVSQSSVSRPTLAIVGAPPVTVPSPVPPAHGGGAGYVGAKQRQLLSETVEAAYRKALKLDEVEVVEAIRKAVKEAIPERPVREPSRIDFERLATDLTVLRGLLAEIEQRSKAIEIQSALDALIQYEIALEEDDMEVLLIAA